jgi:putative tricarboxylic transport membrane protein
MIEPTLQAAWEGLRLVFAWPNLLYPVAGTLLAMAVAFLPGLSGATLMALAIPFTLSWEPLPVVLTFGGLVGGATFMGSVTAILFNVPGTGPSAATLLDGYPLAQQGHAKTAIGCAAMASALGSTVGIVVLIALVPLMRGAILLFGPAEFLMLTLWGLLTVAALGRGAILRALIAAGVGLLLAFIGQDPRTAEPRFTFGTLSLLDGLSFVPVALGLFSIAEMLEMTVSGRGTISGLSRVDQLAGSVWQGAREVFRHFGLFLRSAIIGTVVGIVPGIGGTVASFLAYGQAVQTSKDRGRFGKGDIRGVIAPEAAHDAKDGGSLVPVLAFGIPGSEATAVLMAALVLHGLAPGRELLTDRLPLVFVLIWSLFLSNWITSIVGVLFVRPLARLTILRLHVLAPFVFVLAVLGAFIAKGRMADAVITLGFGVAGYYMKQHGWPRVPVVIALLLGGAFEINLHITLKLHELGRLDLWSRPMLVALAMLTLVSIAGPAVRSAMRRGPERTA